MKKTTLIWLFAALAGSFILASCERLKIDDRSKSVHLDGETAALVNGEPLYSIDVELEAVSQGIIAPGEVFTQDNDQYQIVLDQLIDQRLLAQEAVKRNLDFDENARHRLAIARERILGNLLIESLVAREINEATIQEMYAAQVRLQQLDDEVRISLITVPDEATAKAVIRDYKSGAEFSALAFKYSTDASTRIEGGDLGYIGPAEQPAPFSRIIANTAVGKISDPFQSADDWHVLRVEDRRQRAPKTLEEMRPEIVTFLTYSQINKILRDLRINASITAPDLPQTPDRTGLPQLSPEEEAQMPADAPETLQLTPIDTPAAPQEDP